MSVNCVCGLRALCTLLGRCVHARLWLSPAFYCNHSCKVRRLTAMRRLYRKKRAMGDASADRLSESALQLVGVECCARRVR
jgi:hypothetical protein